MPAGCKRALQQITMAGLLLWARRAGDMNRLLHGRRPPSSNGATAAHAGSVTLPAAVDG